MPETGSWVRPIPLPYRNHCSPSQGAYGSILVVGGTHPSLRCGWAAASDIREIDAQPAMSDNGAGVVNLSAGSGRHTTSDLTGRPRNLSEWGIPEQQPR